MGQLIKKTNFTIVSNSVIMAEELSFKAKGLYAYLCSRPNGWYFFLDEIKNNATDGIKAVRTGLGELEKAGYLQRHRKNGVGGVFEYDYEIFETAQAVSPYTHLGHAVKGNAVKGHAAEGHAVNGTLLIYDISNTDQNNTEAHQFASLAPSVNEQTVNPIQLHQAREIANSWGEYRNTTVNLDSGLIRRIHQAVTWVGIDKLRSAIKTAAEVIEIPAAKRWYQNNPTIFGLMGNRESIEKFAENSVESFLKEQPEKRASAELSKFHV